MDKEKCYKILDKCRDDIEVVFDECNGKDNNAGVLALALIEDIDTLKKFILNISK